MIAPKMPSRTLDICDISTRIVPVQKAFSLRTRRSTKTDGPRIQAKVLVVDDRLLRVGSSNLNNRSMGFDSECDIAIEADRNDSTHDHVRREIASVRNQLVSEHLGVSVGEFEDAMRQHGS